MRDTCTCDRTLPFYIETDYLTNVDLLAFSSANVRTNFARTVAIKIQISNSSLKCKLWCVYTLSLGEILSNIFLFIEDTNAHFNVLRLIRNEYDYLSLFKIYHVVLIKIGYISIRACILLRVNEITKN